MLRGAVAPSSPLVALNRVMVAGFTPWSVANATQQGCLFFPETICYTLARPALVRSMINTWSPTQLSLTASAEGLYEQPGTETEAPRLGHSLGSSQPRAEASPLLTRIPPWVPGVSCPLSCSSSLGNFLKITWFLKVGILRLATSIFPYK